MLGVRHYAPGLPFGPHILSPSHQGMSFATEHNFLSTSSSAQAVVLFMAGEYNDGISRIDGLIATVFFNSTLHLVQVRGCCAITEQRHP